MNESNPNDLNAETNAALDEWARADAELEKLFGEMVAEDEITEDDFEWMMTALQAYKQIQKGE